MPGIIDDDVGNGICACRAADTFSHLLLRGYHPATSIYTNWFKLTPALQVRLTLFHVCHYALMFFIKLISELDTLVIRHSKFKILHVSFIII